MINPDSSSPPDYSPIILIIDHLHSYHIKMILKFYFSENLIYLPSIDNKYTNEICS